MLTTLPQMSMPALEPKSAVSVRERSALCESHREEMASLVTHGLGVILSVVALYAMIIASKGDVTRVVSVSIFGGSLILVYLTSTVYHALTTHRAKFFVQWLDHVSIYILIAGSYTPLTLVTIPGKLGWTLLATVWLLAVIGILLKTLRRRKGRRGSLMSTFVYLGMGWLVLVAAKPVIAELGMGGVAWIVAGGVFYSAGIIFFVWKRLKYHHAIWHLFVMAGSYCHVMAVLFYVLAGS